MDEEQGEIEDAQGIEGVVEACDQISSLILMNTLLLHRVSERVRKQR